MGHKLDKGARVSWNWGLGRGYGYIKEIYTGKIIKEINGIDEIRHGTEEDPAFLIEDEHGHPVLRLKSEVRLED